MELIVGAKFRLGRKIGSGSFGDIYVGKFGYKHVAEDTLPSRIVLYLAIDDFWGVSVRAKERNSQ